MRIILAVLSIFLLSSQSASANPTPLGYWLTGEGEAVVHIQNCKDDTLCGSLYWIANKDRLYDTENPEEELRTRPLCGLKILYDFRQDDDEPDEWEDGHIYKSDDGDTYSGTIRVETQDRLYLRGYVGISLFGKTQTWTRVNPKDYKKCKAP